MDIPIFEYIPVNPLANFGLTGGFWALHIDTIGFTWIAMALLFLGVMATRKWFFDEKGPVYAAIEYSVEIFAQVCVDSVGYFRHDYFYFVTSLFMFTFVSCLVSLLPFIEEPTKDANTTFALATASFLYVLYQKLSQEGFMSYLHELTEPIFLMFPLHVMGEFSRIISMSFRLFGNILGGSVVFFVFVSAIAWQKLAFMYYVGFIGICWLLFFKLLSVSKDSRLAKIINANITVVFILSWLQLFFGVFEAMIQSFVLAMLTVTYLALSVEHDLEEDDEAVLWS